MEYGVSQLWLLCSLPFGVLGVFGALFGSFEPEGEKVIYGLTKNINSYNPLRIAFHEWIDIWNDVRNAADWKEGLRYVFGPPGQKPTKETEAQLQS